MPSLSSLRAIVDALGLHRHADQRLVLVHRAVGGVGQQTDPVGLRAVGDPHLVAVDDVVGAVLAGAGLDGGDVGAGAHLGHTDARHHVALDGGHQELLGQLVGAEASERGRRHVGLHADRHRHAAALDMAQRLYERELIGVVEPHAPVLGGLVDAEIALLAHLLEQVVGGEDAGRLPFIDVRVDLRVDELLDVATDAVVLLGELHRARSSSHACDAKRVGLEAAH